MSLSVASKTHVAKRRKLQNACLCSSFGNLSSLSNEAHRLLSQCYYKHAGAHAQSVLALFFLKYYNFSLCFVYNIVCTS